MLKNIVQIEHGCAISEFNGWYPDLFYGGPEDSDTSTRIVTDVYAALPDHNHPGGVLHQGIGDVDLLMVAIDNGKDRMVYAGPTLSHYEFETSASERMTDAEWKLELYRGNKPQRPEWTSEYLVAKPR